MTDVEVTRNDAARRWEAHIDGVLAGLVEFRDHGDVVVFPHAEVYPRFEAHGVASAMAKVALDATVAAGQMIDPQCPFVSSYIEKHPEYNDSVVQR